MNDDLKNYRAQDDAFSIGFTGDQCVIVLCLVLFGAFVLGPYLL